MATFIPAEGSTPSPLQSASLLIAGALGALPFLLPEHIFPLPSFQAEWLAVALVLVASVLAVASLAKQPSYMAPFPAPAMAALTLAALVAIQSMLHPPAYPSIPVLGVLYMLFAAMSLWLGAQLTATFGLKRVVTLVAQFVLAGAVLTSVLAFIQYYGRPRWLEDLVAGLATDRAYGNIAQANLFANYVALGEASLIYLWANRALRTSGAVAAALMLAGAGALSGARSILLFALWFGALGIWWGMRVRAPDGRRLALAAIGVALTVLAASGAALWLETTANPGVAPSGSLARALHGADAGGEPRWQAWALAWRIFSSSPLFGSGWGSFPGAAFAIGISPAMTRYGEVWMSAHNILLQLLAEAGILGMVIVAAGFSVWGRQVWQKRTAPRPELAWIVAMTGIELFHSMVEYPLWSAHFLGLTALVMGAGVATAPGATPGSRWTLPALAIICGVLALALARTLHDYVVLNISHVTGTTRTLAAPADARRDADAMHALALGIFAPIAETRIVSGSAVEQPAAQETLAMSERVMHFWPSSAVAIRRAIVLAQWGREKEAVDLIDKAIRSYPEQCAAMQAALARALPANPRSIGLLLARMEQNPGASCN